MKSILLLLTIVIIFSNCTTAYKSGQTPDDVYYSPERPQGERRNDDYVRRERNEERVQNRYYSDEAYRDDRYLRMKIRNNRWSGLYDDYYSYNPYYYHYYNGSLSYNSPWSSYSYWNTYYNPYCTPVVVKNAGYSGRTVFNKPRTFDMNVYNPSTDNSNNQSNVKGYRNPNSSNAGSRDNSNNSSRGNSNAGGFLRDIMNGGSSSSSGSSNNSSSSSKTPSSSTPSSSSGSSSGGSSGGSSGSSNAPARKF